MTTKANELAQNMSTKHQFAAACAVMYHPFTSSIFVKADRAQ